MQLNFHSLTPPQKRARPIRAIFESDVVRQDDTSWNHALELQVPVQVAKQLHQTEAQNRLDIFQLWCRLCEVLYPTNRIPFINVGTIPQVLHTASTQDKSCYSKQEYDSIYVHQKCDSRQYKLAPKAFAKLHFRPHSTSIHFGHS